MKGSREKKRKERKPNNTYKSPNRLQQLSFSSIFYSKRCVACMYLKVALRISELESTDNLSSPYSINLSIRAFERFGKSCCNVELTLSRRSVGFDVSSSVHSQQFVVRTYENKLALQKFTQWSLQSLSEFSFQIFNFFGNTSMRRFHQEVRLFCWMKNLAEIESFATTCVLLEANDIKYHWWDLQFLSTFSCSFRWMYFLWFYFH